MEWNILLEASIYFLALINPASKVLLLSSIAPPLSRRLIWEISIKSTLTALGILFLLSTFGHLLLSKLFHVELYALQISGGIILFLFGLKAVQQGRFYESDPHQFHAKEISIVPLGAPMIAGPGMITASITYASEHGAVFTLLALLIALLANLVLMLFSRGIGNLLERLHAAGPLIRITGLIVSAVAVQMICVGASEWISHLR